MEATEEDRAEWIAGGKDLLDYCVCHVEGRRDHCRFHAGGTVHEGPHNVLPELPGPKIEIKYLFDLNPKPLPLEIFGDNGSILMRMSRDGNVEIFGDVNEAALRFWTAVCQISGGILTHKTKQRENHGKEIEEPAKG